MYIAIFLQVRDGSLSFRVKNSVNLNTVAKKTEGIGLKIARRRLDLLYAGNYTLEQNSTEKEYTVNLKIPV